MMPTMAPRPSAEDEEPGAAKGADVEGGDAKDGDTGVGDLVTDAGMLAVAKDVVVGLPEVIVSAVVVVGMGATDSAGVGAPSAGLGTEKAEENAARGSAATTAWQTRSSSSEIWGAVSEFWGLLGSERWAKGIHLAGFAVCA